MNKQIIEVIEDLKVKQEMIDNLHHTNQEESKKLKNLKAKQEIEFDFEREEQIANKQSALNKLQSNINDKENEFEDLYKGHSIKLNNRIRRDKRKLIKTSDEINARVKQVVELERELEDAKLDLRNELKDFDNNYNEKLDKQGNDIVNFRIDEMNFDDIMANI